MTDSGVAEAKAAALRDAPIGTQLIVVRLVKFRATAL